jgi:hypothetical protein
VAFEVIAALKFGYGNDAWLCRDLVGTGGKRILFVKDIEQAASGCEKAWIPGRLAARGGN